MVYTSSSIVVATVEDRQTRWNDQHTLIVTDYTLGVEDRLKGDAPVRLRITVAGGTLDGETHDTCLSTHLALGARYLLFLDDPERPTLSPMTGAWQGVFRELHGSDGHRYVAAGAASTLVRARDSRVEFKDFVETMRAWVAQLQAGPVPKGLQLATAEERAALPFKTWDPAQPRHREWNGIAPPLAELLSPAAPALQQVELGIVSPGEASDDELRNLQEAFVVQRAPAPPVIFNQLPAYFWTSPHDQYMMGTWNVYAGSLFRIYQTPTNTWAWGNGVFDLAGFPPNSHMVQQFGRGWPENALGVTYARWTFGPIIEADIALNPAYRWTLDERLATQPGGPQSFRQTMLHELGHSWGLQHPWEQQNVWWDSVMNYAPQEYRLATLMSDDAEAVRRTYPGTSIHDVIVSGYTTRDTDGSNHATYVASRPSPSSVRAGASFSLTNRIKIENGGTDNIVNPSVEIYLVRQRMSWANAIYLKTVRFTTTIKPYSISNLSLGSIRVPSNVPAGTYYVGYFVRDARDGFVNNNSAWSDWNGTIRVTR